MSTAFSSSFSSQIHSSSSTVPQDVPQNSSVSTFQLPASLSGPSTSTASSTWQQGNASVTTSSPATISNKKAINPKKRTSEELEYMKQTSARFASRMATDHAAVLHPDADTPFTDQFDVVNRLLPYHIFQQPKEDLGSPKISKRKGKEKAIESDLKAEIEETKFALECYRRRDTLRDRFRKVKIRSGKRSAPDCQAYVLAQAVLEVDRAECSWLNTELRSARSELERIEREKRAVANPTRITQFPAAPMSAATTMQQHYYRGYPYAYTQAYGTHIPSHSTSTFSVSPVPPVAPPTPTVPYAPYQSSGAIPVQLPVASLPALHALGIVPVPASSLPPEGQPQPPAVLRGSTANGSMLSLEINVSLLQSAQMSGLAIVLNSLMSRSSSGAPPTGQNLSSSPPGPTPSGG